MRQETMGYKWVIEAFLTLFSFGAFGNFHFFYRRRSSVTGGGEMGQYLR